VVFAYGRFVALHRGQEDVEAAPVEVVFERRHVGQIFAVADEVDAGRAVAVGGVGDGRWLRPVSDSLFDVLL